MRAFVSVLMTSYNRESFISEAIESVLRSTYQDFELIIVDDGSKDGTIEIARSYAEKDSRIRLIVNDTNLGDYPNRNRAAGFAKGDLIMFVDSDDTIFPDGIQKCIETMEKFQHASFGMYSHERGIEPYLLKSSVALRLHLLDKPFLSIGPGGTIIRRAFFEQLHGYPEKYGPANDLYFNLKALCYSDIVMLPFSFFMYRIHPGQERNNHLSYLYNNYVYMNDALLALKLPVSNKELNWLR